MLIKNKLILLSLSMSLSLPAHADPRTQAVEELLNNYTRPITVLDLTPGDGSLMLQLAKKYDGVFVMASETEYVKLLRACRASKQDNVIVLAKPLTPDLLDRLGRCEHFDLILAYDVVRTYSSDWQSMARFTLKLGDYVFMDAPSADTLAQHYLLSKNGVAFAQTDTATSYSFALHRSTLQHSHWFWRSGSTYQISSSFTAKTLTKQRFERSYSNTWLPGINLLTFQKLWGIFPTKQMLHGLITPFAQSKHDDLTIYNIIIQGSHTKLIDDGEFEGLVNDNAARVQQILKQLGVTQT